MKLDEDVFGKKAPQGLDPDVFRSVQPMFVEMPQQIAQSSYTPTEGFFQSALIGAGRTFDRIGAGMQQLYYGARGNDEKLAALQADQDEKTRLYQPLKQARPWATGIGEALPAMAVPMGGAASSAAALATKTGLGNAALGAMEYGSAGERAGTALMQGAGGAAGALAGKALGSGLARLGNLQPFLSRATPAQQSAAAVLDGAGVPLSIGERSASRVARGLEDAMQYIPATAGTAQAQKIAQQQALNQATARLAGVNSAGLTHITPDIAAAARKGAGQEIGNIAARNTMQVGSPVMSQILNLQNEVGQFAAQDVAKPVLARINQALQKIETDAAGNTVMNGRAYRELQSAIGKQMKNASGDLKGYLGTLRETLRDGMNASISAADQKAWAKANETYRNAITLEDVAARSATGDISPTALFQASKKAPKEMRELGAAANALIRPLPTSGTAERSLSLEMLQNPLAAAVKGMATVPAIGAQKMMTAASRRPQGLLPLEPWMMRLPGVGLGYGGGLLGGAFPQVAGLE